MRRACTFAKEYLRDDPVDHHKPPTQTKNTQARIVETKESDERDGAC